MIDWSVIVGNLIPHGYCLSWQPHLLWLHGVADAVTAVAYYSIPLMLLLFVRRRRDLQFSWIFILFGVFIMACGATHVMSLWTLWRPDYLAAGIIKAVTAIVSISTAAVLLPLIPKALALPGPAQWEAVNRKLRNEITEHSQAEDEIRRLNADLEQRVAARTAELQAANEELRASEQHFRGVVESAPYAIVLADSAGRIALVNARTEKLFGHAREALIGQTVEMLIPPRFRGGHEAQSVGYFAASGITAMAPDREIYGLHRDGHEIPVEINLNPIRTAERQLALVSIADISERKQAAAEHQARQAAEAASRAKSEFLSTMSHELRTPLNAVLGYAQLLRRDAGLSERQAAGLATIEQSGQHLLMLINDILDLAKIEAGKFDLAPAPFDPAAAVSVVTGIIRIKAEEKSLLFSSAISNALPRAVRADEKRLRQILLNLLSNAVKFTDRGRVALKVAVLPDPPAGSIRLHFEVDDTGIGMRPDQLQAIFHPFEQVGDAHRRTDGSGLGLAISRQLVRLMGGDIHVESRPGLGSRFWFDLVLPLADMAPVTAVRRIVGYAGPRRTALIVDDVVGNRLLLADLLGGLGFALDEANDGRAAVARVEAAPPDIVLIDLVMPEMDGIEAIRRIRAIPGQAGLPIVAVSASADFAERNAAIAAGANAFLPKPIDQEQLLQVVRASLGLSWHFAEPAPEPDAATADAAADIVIPPAATLAELHELALAGDMRAVRLWANRLAGHRRYAEFADILMRLSGRYQSKAVLELVERHLSSQEQPT